MAMEVAENKNEVEATPLEGTSEKAVTSSDKEEVIIGGKFRLGSKIGSGSFGAIHLGVNLRTGEEVAIKLEPLRSRHPQLLYEAKIYKGLAGSVGIPSIHWYGVQDAYTVMVLDLLGPSLEDLLNFCKGRLNLKTVLMIADQMINRLECVHSRNVIHRDVKPDNFLLGLGRRANQVNLIDFGLSKKYRDSKTQVHIPYREGKALTGTARYASINTHAGLEQSRRDDLEALGYVLIYLVKGCLPWQGLPSKTPKTKQERYDEIMQQKINTSLKDLCKDLPHQFEEYLTYCRKLQFEERPDYGYLRQLLRDAFAKEGFQLDFVYDWSLVGKLKTDPPAKSHRCEQRDNKRRPRGRRHHKNHEEHHQELPPEATNGLTGLAEQTELDAMGKALLAPAADNDRLACMLETGGRQDACKGPTTIPCGGGDAVCLSPVVAVGAAHRSEWRG